MSVFLRLPQPAKYWSEQYQRSVNAEIERALQRVPDAGGGGGTTLPAGGTTGQLLAKASNADYDYEYVDAAGGSSPLTTKGDLYTYSTVDDRLGVGADGYLLAADSTEATGLKWTTGWSRLDTAEEHSAGKGTEEVVLSIVSTEVNVDPSLSNTFYLVLDEDVTDFTIADGSVATGQVIDIVIAQDGTGGWTVTFGGTNLLWVGGAAPTITDTASAVDRIGGRWCEALGKWLLGYGQAYA